jgi:hypothetical protein
MVVEVVGRGRGAVTGVTDFRAVVTVVGDTRGNVVVVAGAAVVVVVSAGAVVTVVGGAGGAASSITAGWEGGAATPLWSFVCPPLFGSL